ncbi:MAG: tRNA 2-thiouridine(34) synthase MnmA [Bacteroidota bacterium]
MKKASDTRVMVAMSGGVDSSAAAILLKEQGYDLLGVTMKVVDYSNYPEYRGKTDDDAVRDAAEVAAKLGFSHHVVDLRQEFREAVIENFKSEYLQGRTPNPCAICNPLIKWQAILEYAAGMDVDYLATGHYARVKQSGGRYYISRGLDQKKDQSYMLWGLSQEQLGKTMLPLGGYTKDEIRDIADGYCFEKLSQKKESFEICFIPDDDYRRFLKTGMPELESKMANGKIVTTDGKEVGNHKGFPFYTIGQRRGLEIALGVPMYVTKIDAANNRIVIGEKEQLLSDKMIIKDVNLMKYPVITDGQDFKVKVRYHHTAQMARISSVSEGLQVEFSKAVSAVTPGQSAVIYEDEDVVGGGIIFSTSG